jgi:hypothetical protein
MDDKEASAYWIERGRASPYLKPIKRAVDDGSQSKTEKIADDPVA